MRGWRDQTAPATGVALAPQEHSCGIHLEASCFNYELNGRTTV